MLETVEITFRTFQTQELLQILMYYCELWFISGSAAGLQKPDFIMECSKSHPSIAHAWSASDTPPVFAGPFQGIPPPSCWHVSGVLRVLLLNLVVSPNDNGMHGHSYTMLHLYNIMINLQPRSIRAIPPTAHRCTSTIYIYKYKSCSTIMQSQRSRALLTYDMCGKARTSPLNTWSGFHFWQMPHFSQGCQHKSRKCKVTWAKSSNFMQISHGSQEASCRPHPRFIQSTSWHVPTRTRCSWP